MKLSDDAGLTPIVGGQTALLLQGLQNDLFGTGGRLVDPGLSAFAEEIEMFQNIRALRSAIARTGGAVIHAVYVVEPEALAQPTNAALYRTIVDSGAVRRGTWGARILDQCAPNSGDIVLEKTRENPFFGTRLQPLLDGLGTQTVICAGATTNMGVETAARHASDAGYQVVVPHDSCAAHDTEWQDASINHVMKKIATVTTTDELCSSLT